MNPIDFAYFPLLIFLPCYLMLCVNATSGPLSALVSSIFKSNSIVKTVVWTLMGTCLIFCIICIVSAYENPYRSDYREGALASCLNLVLLLGIQNLGLTVEERNKITIDRDMMKKQAIAIAEFSNKLMSEGKKATDTIKSESAMPEDSKSKTEEESGEARKRK